MESARKRASAVVQKGMALRISDVSSYATSSPNAKNLLKFIGTNEGVTAVFSIPQVQLAFDLLLVLFKNHPRQFFSQYIQHQQASPWLTPFLLLHSPDHVSRRSFLRCVLSLRVASQELGDVVNFVSRCIENAEALGPLLPPQSRATFFSRRIELGAALLDSSVAFWQVGVAPEALGARGLGELVSAAPLLRMVGAQGIPEFAPDVPADWPALFVPRSVAASTRLLLGTGGDSLHAALWRAFAGATCLAGPPLRFGPKDRYSMGFGYAVCSCLLFLAVSCRGPSGRRPALVLPPSDSGVILGEFLIFLQTKYDRAPPTHLFAAFVALLVCVSHSDGADALRYVFAGRTGAHTARPWRIPSGLRRFWDEAFEARAGSPNVPVWPMRTLTTVELDEDVAPPRNLVFSAAFSSLSHWVRWCAGRPRKPVISLEGCSMVSLRLQPFVDAARFRNSFHGAVLEGHLDACSLSASLVAEIERLASAVSADGACEAEHGLWGDQKARAFFICFLLCALEGALAVAPPRTGRHVDHALWGEDLVRVERLRKAIPSILKAALLLAPQLKPRLQPPALCSCLKHALVLEDTPDGLVGKAFAKTQKVAKSSFVDFGALFYECTSEGAMQAERGIAARETILARTKRLTEKFALRLSPVVSFAVGPQDARSPMTPDAGALSGFRARFAQNTPVPPKRLPSAKGPVVVIPRKASKELSSSEIDSSSESSSNGGGLESLMSDLPESLQGRTPIARVIVKSPKDLDQINNHPHNTPFASRPTGQYRLMTPQMPGRPLDRKVPLHLLRFLLACPVQEFVKAGSRKGYEGKNFPQPPKADVALCRAVKPIRAVAPADLEDLASYCRTFARLITQEAAAVLAKELNVKTSQCKGKKRGIFLFKGTVPCTLRMLTLLKNEKTHISPFFVRPLSSAGKDAREFEYNRLALFPNPSRDTQRFLCNLRTGECLVLTLRCGECHVQAIAVVEQTLVQSNYAVIGLAGEPGKQIFLYSLSGIRTSIVVDAISIGSIISELRTFEALCSTMLLEDRERPAILSRVIAPPKALANPAERIEFSTKPIRPVFDSFAALSVGLPERAEAYFTSAFNPVQRSAIARLCAIYDAASLEKPALELIHGPPGTGKTHTLVGLIRALLLTRRSKGPSRRPPRVLLLAASNLAVDEAARRILAELPRVEDLADGWSQNSQLPACPSSLVHRGIDSTSCRLPLLVRTGVVSQTSGEILPFHIEAAATCVCSGSSFVCHTSELLWAVTMCGRLGAARRSIDALQLEASSGHGEIDRRAREMLEVRRNEAEKIEALLKKLPAATLDLAKHLDENCVQTFVESDLKILGDRSLGYSVSSLDTLSRETLIKRADVVATTLSSLNAPSLTQILASLPPFDAILIEEAGQSIEPSVFAAIARHVPFVVLSGDPDQLPPTVISTSAASAGLSTSLMERLVSCGKQAFFLSVQYRMLQPICDFPSRYFYQSRLETAPDVLKRGAAPLPASLSGMFGPYLFINLASGPDEVNSGNSRQNEEEASFVVSYVRFLLEAAPQLAGEIGVITPYSGQRELLRRKWKDALAFAPNARGRFSSRPFPEVRLPQKCLKVQTVDGFQGQEKRVVVISTVRSNPEAGVGFLASSRRANVSLTRARDALIIVGSAKTLARNNLWQRIIKDAKHRSCYVTLRLRDIPLYRDPAYKNAPSGRGAHSFFGMRAPRGRRRARR
eukprot:gnl/Chilomastix_cuspidata/2197.p1 GENE.gnl/Chilomastix_cuspidata/2197~~gnl/Chilomastix_cuspidata/2197.p1  ORF type:complete len:1705 (-),score=367.11 gnl/Chilomastix_cuspidata/2197:56-5170(-)